MIASDLHIHEGAHAHGCACAHCADAAPAEQTATATGQAVDTFTGDADQNVDALISGSKWATTDLTFAFPDSADDYSYGFNGEAASGFAQLNAAQMVAARAALDAFAAVSGLTFTELTGAEDRDADLVFAESAAPSTAWAYYPSTGDWGGDSWFNPGDYNNPQTGGYAWATFMHETGHALGLKHGQDASGGGPLNFAQDSHEYSIMTYRSYVGSSGAAYTNGAWGGPQTPMMYDIAAIQRMYGANHAHEAGDTTYSVDTASGELFIDGIGQGAPGGGGVVFRTIWDGSGVDTYDFSALTRDLAVDLAPGGYVDLDVGGDAQRAYLGGGVRSRGHIFNALTHEGDLRSLIENAVGGAGDDVLSGNQAANALSGGDGRDTLSGFSGDDTLTGGAGADLFVLGAGGGADRVEDLTFADGDALSVAGLGGDHVSAGLSLDASGGVRVGDLDDLARLTLLDGASLSDLAGAAAFDFIGTGWSGAVLLVDIAYQAVFDAASALTITAPPPPTEAPGSDGGSAAGDDADPTEGGGGDGGGGDGGGGGGGAVTRVSGLATGGADADVMAGGGGDDTLRGRAGADDLAGEGGDDVLRGGRDGDTLKGGAGGDLLAGGRGRDDAHGGGGRDTIKGGRGADTADGGAGRDVVRGGRGDDVVDGGAGADRLFGGGGADTLDGGAGSDLLTGGAGADLFRFTTAAGVDRIADFSDGADRIAAAGADRFADLSIDQIGANVRISLGDDAGGARVIIEDARAEDFSASDFIFS